MHGQLFIGTRDSAPAVVLYEAPGIPRVALSKHNSLALARTQARRFTTNRRLLSQRLVHVLAEKHPATLTRIAAATSPRKGA